MRIIFEVIPVPSAIEIIVEGTPPTRRHIRKRLSNFLSRESELSMNLLNCADNFPILKL